MEDAGGVCHTKANLSKSLHNNIWVRFIIPENHHGSENRGRHVYRGELGAIRLQSNLR